jgi:hypothetical protein
MSPAPRPWQRIATLSIASGVRFFAHFPGHYEPRLEFEGCVRRNGDVAIGEFSIAADDVGTAIVHRQQSPIALNIIHPLACDGCAEDLIEFRFSISDSPNGDNLLRYGQPAPRLSQQQVIGIAMRAAADAGFTIDDYEAPKVDYESAPPSGTWMASFTLRPPGLPGHHFSVLIEDTSGKATVMAGE